MGKIDRKYRITYTASVLPHYDKIETYFNKKIADKRFSELKKIFYYVTLDKVETKTSITNIKKVWHGQKSAKVNTR